MATSRAIAPMSRCRNVLVAGEVVILCAEAGSSPQSAPDLTGPETGFFSRADPCRPRARVAFRRPFPRRVNAHLPAVRRKVRGIVEIVDWSLRHLHVARRIHVRPY